MTDSTDLKIFNKTLHSRRAYVFAGIGILSIASLTLGWMIHLQGQGGKGDDTAFWFIGLLVIFMTALATTATVFAGLRMSNPLEAFGLPSGSVRALLAVGIMVMLVVFGLTYLSGSDQPSERTIAPKPFQIVPVTPETINAETARYEALNVAVVKRSATEIALHQKIGPRPQEERDLHKQLLTAIITLLTTVIGFYFGSRSASEGQREEDRNLATLGGPPPDLAVERSALGDEFKTLSADLTARGQELDGIEKLPPPTDAQELRTRTELVTAARSAAAAIEAHRKATADALDRYDAAMKSLTEEARADIRKVHESDARDALKAARASITQLAAAYPGYAQQMETLTQATAEG